MPSLRRSFSSPSVRSSPYPPSLSTPSPSVVRTRQTAHQPRRSSGSATAERRVLADIEWWRVYDGQCDLDLQDQFQELADSDAPPSGTVTLSAGGVSMEAPYIFSMDSMQAGTRLSNPRSHADRRLQSVHSDTLALLSIAPHGTGRHSRDSSVESTPELSTAPLETIQLDLDSYPLGYHLFPPSPTRVGGRQVHPLFGLRSVSAPVSHRSILGPDFADMGGDLFSFDQNVF